MAENLIYDFGSIFYAWFHLKRGKWKSAHAYIQKYHAIYIQKSQKLIIVATLRDQVFTKVWNVIEEWTIWTSRLFQIIAYRYLHMHIQSKVRCRKNQSKLGGVQDINHKIKWMRFFKTTRIAARVRTSEFCYFDIEYILEQT